MRLNEIAERYQDRVDFYCVYIQEAHPDDGWQVQSNIESELIYRQHRSLDERAEVAQVCALRLDLRMPLLLDDMSNTVDAAYNALPERLYLVDAGGRVVFKSLAGSPGFDPGAWEQAMRGHLGLR